MSGRSPEPRTRRGRYVIALLVVAALGGAIALITADGAYRRGGIVPLKKNVDDALRDGTSVRRVIVFRRVGNEIRMEERRDVWWHQELEYVDANCTAAPLDSVLLYSLYLYQKGFRDFQMGYAASMAWVLLLVVACFTTLIFRSASRWVYYEAESGERG